jgi:hypothetical protein
MILSVNRFSEGSSVQFNEHTIGNKSRLSEATPKRALRKAGFEEEDGCSHWIQAEKGIGLTTRQSPAGILGIDLVHPRSSLNILNSKCPSGRGSQARGRGR